MNIFLYEFTGINGEPIEFGSTPDLEATFVGLEPCTEYRFRVKASNDIGDSEFSNYVNWETNAGKLFDIF